MIFFRVSENINIKITDGTLVNYLKFKAPVSLENETVYMSTREDFNDLKDIFQKVDKNKYFVKILKEENIRTNVNFPIELGILNQFEYERDIDTFFDLKPTDIYKQLKNIDKKEVSIALIGGVGKSIGQIVSSCTALRILHKKLKEIYKNVKFDVFINASNNSYYSRDKEIYKTQNYINNIFPLSINSKKLCEYDYFIDNSLNAQDILKELNNVDAWLYKFGINYKKVDQLEKYNNLDLSQYKIQNDLKTKIEQARKKGKLLLFHPYSANINKSIPQVIAIDLLKKLLKLEEYVIVTTLQVDSKLKDSNFIDLTNESKSISDFIYIISNMDKIITADTSTYHISDSFMIPTVVIFTDKDYEKKIKYYKYTKAIYVKDKSKNFSNFIYESEDLTLYKLEAWKKLKIDKIMKILDNF
jgi:ADP-heptose:LPS heptosyltransferase